MNTRTGQPYLHVTKEVPLSFTVTVVDDGESARVETLDSTADATVDMLDGTRDASVTVVLYNETYVTLR